MKIVAIVTDIEGTTSSIGFVHNVLFPYALKQIGNFIREHHEERDVMRILVRIGDRTGLALHNTEGFVKLLQQWIREDKDDADLKLLEGMVWERAYKQGLFQAHVYADVPEVLQKWQDRECNLYSFSSASIKAQQLYFRFSDFGDMRLLFSGYFDTTMGEKRDVQTYANIAQAIALEPECILFISDDKDELDAAEAAGMRTTWVIRPQDTSLDPERVRVKTTHPVVTGFEQIEVA
ncbi:MAG: acireductone synthase [Pseudomonadales bacterium]|nr:acireductone synthase [Pseudomonadales bacterium]MCP5357337.1 acireductone synthase [Pseudomonadales bacterium]